MLLQALAALAMFGSVALIFGAAVLHVEAGAHRRGVEDRRAVAEAYIGSKRT